MRSFIRNKISSLLPVYIKRRMRSVYNKFSPAVLAKSKIFDLEFETILMKMACTNQRVMLLKKNRLKRSERRRVFFFDDQGFAGDLKFAEKLAQKNNNFLVFKRRDDYEFFLDRRPSNSENNRIFLLPTIDHFIDDSVYEVSGSIAGRFLRKLISELSNNGNFESFIGPLKAVETSFMDRVQIWTRASIFLNRFIDIHGIEEGFIVTKGVQASNILAFLISEESKITCSVLSDLNYNGPVSINDLAGKRWSLPEKAKVSGYSFLETESPNGVLLYAGNLKDPQYRDTAIPVLNGLSEHIKSRIVVMDSAMSGVDSEISGEKILRPVLRDFSDDSLEDFKLCFDSAFKGVLENSCSEKKDELLHLFVLLSSRHSLFKLTADCFALKTSVESLREKVDVKALISSPGRLWFAQCLVGCMPEIPSFEIQGGILSRTPRYRKPISEYLLAVDDYSKEIYCEYLGFENDFVHVVGAPRIDAKLSEVRKRLPSESRTFLGFPEDAKLLCVATQPFGTQLMEVMVREAAKILNSDHENWHLVVSMHPNETVEYEAAYKRILAEYFSSGRARISRGDIYNWMNAADGVVTYFSTSGLEAFCLGRCVFSFRQPGNDSVPFDLCKLGVARPFASGEELQNLLSERRTGEAMSVGLRNLRDGRSVQRICHFIAEFV